jgi:hypothetical protein
MWVWGYPAPNDLIAFARAHHISELFVTVAPDVATSGDLPRLQQLKSLADIAQIHLQALGGDPTWTTDYTDALAWQRAALATGLFEGAHVDVEPYSLAAWNSDQAGTVASYLALLDQLKADSSLPLEVDVPFWYGTIPANGFSSLADAVLATVNAVSVMSYRDTATGPNSIFDIGTDWLQRGAAAYKPVRLGAETNQLSDCPTCTFYGEGSAALINALSAVDAAAAIYTDYAGMAVEDYDGWFALAGPPPTAPAPTLPTVTLTAAPNLITLGQNTTLSWSSTNATACAASGAWSGIETTAGSVVEAPTQVGTLFFTLTCTGNAGSSSAKLIQDLKREGILRIKAYEPPPKSDKEVRMHTQTIAFENGSILLPKEAPWLAEYIRELTGFPGAAHDDQVDSTAQALDYLRGNGSSLDTWMRLSHPGSAISRFM